MEETGAYTKDDRRIRRGLRKVFLVRPTLTPSALLFFLDFALTPGSETYTTLIRLLHKGRENEMEVDTASSPAPTQRKITPPQLEMLCYLFVLLFLIDKKMYNEAKACASASIARLKSLKRRVPDVLASKFYSYYSLSYELTGSLAEIRGELLALHCLATLHHDELGQETLLNLLLRNYLHYNLYHQAEKLRSNAPSFEAHSNQQHCRYLFYVGKIQTIQSEYMDAKESLLQATRKAPIRARGFRIQCSKWAVIVLLLLGETPKRTTFMQKGMEDALQPYFELTNVLGSGSGPYFRNCNRNRLYRFLIFRNQFTV